MILDRMKKTVTRLRQLADYGADLLEQLRGANAVENHFENQCATLNSLSEVLRRMRALEGAQEALNGRMIEAGLVNARHLTELGGRLEQRLGRLEAAGLASRLALANAWAVSIPPGGVEPDIRAGLEDGAGSVGGPLVGWVSEPEVWVSRVYREWSAGGGAWVEEAIGAAVAGGATLAEFLAQAGPQLRGYQTGWFALGRRFEGEIGVREFAEVVERLDGYMFVGASGLRRESMDVLSLRTGRLPVPLGDEADPEIQAPTVSDQDREALTAFGRGNPDAELHRLVAGRVRRQFQAMTAELGGADLVAGSAALHQKMGELVRARTR